MYIIKRKINLNTIQYCLFDKCRYIVKSLERGRFDLISFYRLPAILGAWTFHDPGFLMGAIYFNGHLENVDIAFYL